LRCEASKSSSDQIIMCTNEIYKYRRLTSHPKQLTLTSAWMEQMGEVNSLTAKLQEASLGKVQSDDWFFQHAVGHACRRRYW
jgi:hypothetical protein